jgi:hypothetical protein
MIPAKAKKLAYLDEKIKEKVESVAEEIRDNLDIDNVWDASYFYPGTRAEFTLIDFAQWDSHVYECFLYENLILNPDLRDKLERENPD